MTETRNDFWDDLFLDCAFAAYVELAAECRGVPDAELARRRAFAYFEDALAAKQGRSPRDGLS